MWGLVPLVVAGAALVTIVVSAILGRRAFERTASPGHWEELLAFVLLCSLVSFALIETGKRLLPIRERVQYRFLWRWWNDRATSVGASGSTSWKQLMESMDLRVGFYEGTAEKRSRPVTRLLDNPVFGLPVQLLSAQISNAVDSILAEPGRELELYYTITWSASDARQLREALFRLPNPEDFSGEGAEVYRQYFGDLAEDARQYLKSSGLPIEMLTHTLQASRRRLDAQTDEPVFDQFLEPLSTLLEPPDTPEDPRSFRAAQRARTTLDSLQVAVGEHWRRSVQATAVLIAGIAGLLIQLTQPSYNRWLFVLAAALIGGPIAWTIRDVTALIERWRR